MTALIRSKFVLVAIAAAVRLAVGADPFQQQCLSFRPESYVYNSTRTALEYVSAGSNLSFPDNDASCGRPNQAVSNDVCRAALSIPTSNRSSITFELWLPKNWTGRFLATGNGGVDGCIKYEDLAYASGNGFASVGANNGHNGTTGVAFYQNADIIRDFADRSLHTSTTVGKQLVNAFYNQSSSKSYYIGCSLGGRQGIHAADLYPTDFDGVLAGSPALDFNNLYSWRASFFPITGAPGSPTFIPASTWTTLIHNEVLRQCDHLDGAVDGILEDASLCNFRPEDLLCASSSTNSSDCLTSAQVSTVRRIFSPFYGLNGTLIYPAMQPGSERMAASGLYAGKPFPYSVDWFRYVVYNNPNWDPSTFDLSSAALADQLNPFDIRTWPVASSSGLTSFRDRGGKVITFHGGQDQQITSFDTPRFYDALARGTSSTSAELDDWIRFFRISGMFHCSGGPGAWVLGQGGNAAAGGIPFRPENNVLAALVAWVEKDEAPETMEGTKFVNDTVGEGVDFTRRHCRYPLRNTFLGGNSKDSTSWECQ